MKYVIDIPNQNLAGAQANLSVAGYCFNFQLKPLCEPKKPELVYFRTPQHKDTAFETMYFGGIPIVRDPTFETDPPVPGFYVGDTWETVGGDRVRIIARHSDGEFEVSVVHRRQNFDPKDERRGTRVGSSFIVTKYGRVKPGHLAPPSSMGLCRKVASLASEASGGLLNKHRAPVGKSATMMFMDELANHSYAVEVDVPTPWTRTGIQKEIHAATRAYVTREELDKFRASLRDETYQIAAQLVRESDEMANTKLVLKDEMNKAIADALKAYDAAKVKLFVGKTYVTRNGSQVEVDTIAAHDGHTTGHITRGGTSKHCFKCTVGFRKDGKFAGDFRSSRFDDARWDTEHPLDIMHEVLNASH